MPCPKHKAALFRALLPQWSLFSWGHPWPGWVQVTLHSRAHYANQGHRWPHTDHALCSDGVSPLWEVYIGAREARKKCKRLSAEKANILSTSPSQLHGAGLGKKGATTPRAGAWRSRRQAARELVGEVKAPTWDVVSSAPAGGPAQRGKRS